MKKMLFFMVFFCLFATCAFAQSQTHDGFFLRMSPGLGQMELKTGETTFEDASGVFSLMLGGAVSENTILHVELATASMTDPDMSDASFSGRVNGDMSTSLFGFGLTQYYMPANAYVSVTVGSAQTTIDDGESWESDDGLGVKLMIGKEWWISDNWGLGLAGQVLYANCGGGDISTSDIKTMAYALLFSATYN